MKQKITTLLFLIVSLGKVFSQVEDSIPPILNWITVTPASVHNNDTITIQMNVTDDVSGVSHVGAYLGSPDNSLYQNLNGGFKNIGNNTYETKVKISNWAISGQWFISSIYLVDKAGNNKSPNDKKYFTVNSTSPDANAPTLNWITITPTTVHNNDTITVQMNVTDDVSGVSHVGAYLGSPDNSLYQNLNGGFKNIGNNTYETKVKINNWAISGQWFISSLYMVDKAGNNYSPNDKKYFTVINIGTLINDNIEKNNFKIYPNPTNDFLYINNEDDKSSFNKICIYDYQGKLVSEKIDTNNKIDLINLNKGIYIVKIETTKGIYTTKIIKE